MPRLAALIQPPPRPMVFVALAWLGGVALGLNLPAAPLALAGLALACLGWGGWRYWRERRVHGPRLGGGAALLLALLLAGWSQGARVTREDQAKVAEVAPWADGDLVCVEGTVAEEPRGGGDEVSLVLGRVTVSPLRVGGASACLSARVAVRVGDEAARELAARPGALPLPGQPLRAWGRLRPISAQTNPISFDPLRHAESRDVQAVLGVSRPGDLELGPEPGGLRAGALKRLRAVRAFMAREFEARLPPAQALLARALFLGQGYMIPQEMREAYGATNLAHLLAVAGLHTAFVLLILIGLARLCGLGPRGGAWVGIAGLVAFAALTGFLPPVVRAATMGIFILGGMILGRVASTPASLATAAFVTLLADPRNLLRLDWQLSYGCVLGITLAAPPLYEWAGSLLAPQRSGPTIGAADDEESWLRRQTKRWVVLPLAVVIAVQLVLLPLQIFYFRQFNILSPLFNIVAVDFAFVAMGGTFATALVGWVPGLGALAAWVARIGLGSMNGFTQWGGHWPWPVVYANSLPLPVLALYYALLLGGSWLRSGEGSEGRLGRAQMAGLVLRLPALLALLIWSALLTAPSTAGALDLYALDVGQGDALVLRFPNQKVMVVDAGPAAPADQGRLTVAPFLRVLGAGVIDCLVATHADADHIGGMPTLLGAFRVRHLAQGPDVASSEIFRLFQEKLKGGRTRVDPLDADSRLKELCGFAPARVAVLGPLAEARDNNASVVLRVEYGRVSFLLTGDLEADGERRLIEAGLVSPVDVLKLGHHGSRSSTSEPWLATCRPGAALISVGRHNRFGHPSPEVLARLKAHHIAAYRTDELGALWVRTDGQTIRIYGYAGP